MLNPKLVDPRSNLIHAVTFVGDYDPNIPANGDGTLILKC